MTATQRKFLPSEAKVPRTHSMHEVSLQERVWLRSQTLFLSVEDGFDPDHTPDCGYVALATAHPHVFVVYKPNRAETSEFTQSRYEVNLVEQTCTCPFYAGDGAKPGKKYCKHVWAFLFWMAEKGTLPPSPRLTTPVNTDDQEDLNDYTEADRRAA